MKRSKNADIRKNGSLEDLVNRRQDGWIGEINRRCQEELKHKPGYEIWDEYFAHCYGAAPAKVFDLDARRKRMEERGREPETAGDLDKRDRGLLEAIRSQYRPYFERDEVPASANWNDATSPLWKEAQKYLDYFDVWAEDWEPPKNVSLTMVRRLLSFWASLRPKSRRAGH